MAGISSFCEYCAGTSKNKHIDKERVENGRSNNQGTWPDFCESMHGELLERMYTPVFFLLGILWDIFYHKRKEAVVFLYYVIFLALTVYNPFLVRYIVPKVDFENEYYRFIWILPVIPGVAYYAVRLVSLIEFKTGKVLLAVLLGGVIIITGTPIPGIAQNFAMAENIYKVPNELRSICDVIHEDSKKEEPRVVLVMI